MSWVALGVGVVSVGVGIAKDAKANKLVKERTPYSTPSEMYDILNATSSMASNGYDAFTLNYLQEQINRAGGQSLNAATRLNADPNEIADILDREIMGYMKIGADNSAQQYARFDKFMEAKKMIAGSKDAEWSSRDSLLKDRIAAAAQQKQDAFQNAYTSFNAAGSLYAMDKQKSLYDTPDADFWTAAGKGAASQAK